MSGFVLVRRPPSSRGMVSKCRVGRPAPGPRAVNVELPEAAPPWRPVHSIPTAVQPVISGPSEDRSFTGVPPVDDVEPIRARILGPEGQRRRQPILAAPEHDGDICRHRPIQGADDVACLLEGQEWLRESSGIAITPGRGDIQRRRARRRGRRSDARHGPVTGTTTATPPASGQSAKCVPRIPTIPDDGVRIVDVPEAQVPAEHRKLAS